MTEEGRTGLEVAGTEVTLRYPDAADATALAELGGDPEVTRFFSWGPYRRVEEAAEFVASLPARRESGEALEMLIVHGERGPAGLTGLSEVSLRDRRCVIGTWLGRSFWGSGINEWSKGLMAHFAFGPLGMERLTAHAAVENERSQAALERLGFRREGVLEAWHRHGDRVYDLVVYAFLRADWERSPLHGVKADVRGAPPAAWVV